MSAGRNPQGNKVTRAGQKSRFTRGAALTLAVALGAVACGNDADGGLSDAAPVGVMAAEEAERANPESLPDVEAEQPSVNADPASPSSSGRPGAISRWEDVQSGVVRIEILGEFVEFDPSRDELTLLSDSTFFGSGFFIESEGIVVTNNHVVNGAAALNVYVPGESSPRNAQVLGLSECWDLAVIDVDGEDYPYFDWATVSPEPPLDIFAVGYPGGAPDISVSEGVISRANTDGESPFASVDVAIEHTAQTAGGSSGGPLVTADGFVVGVHNAASRDSQFAISAHDAEAVISQLKLGNDVDVIGITAEALPARLGGGVLVKAVQTGSPAHNAGIEPGDIVLELEEVSVGADGTLATYCDILRSHAPDAPLQVTYVTDGATVQATLPRAQ